MGTPGLSQSLFGEGGGWLSASQEAQNNAQNNANGVQSIGAPININDQGAGSNATGPYQSNVTGNDLISNQVSTSTPSVSSNLYGNAIGLANAQAANYQQQGNAAFGTKAPTINNADAGALQSRLGGINKGYTSLNDSLAASAAGRGINAGQAQYQGAQDSSIAAAMAAAHGRGGSGIGGQLGGASQAFQGAGMQAAQTRASQIGAAQQGLGSSLNAQGGMNLSTYGAQNQLASQSAALQAGQNAQNDQQALNLYGLSQAQQNAAASDLQQYNTQAVNTQNAGTAHQSTQNSQLESEIGTGAALAGTAIALA